MNIYMIRFVSAYERMLDKPYDAYFTLEIIILLMILLDYYTFLSKKRKDRDL